MTEQKKGTLSLSSLSGLKKSPEPQGRVRQSFSHGKSKVVAVEVKKKRTPIKTPGAMGSAQPVQQEASISERYAGGALSDQEIENRIKAIQSAIKENKKQEEARLQKEKEEEERRRIELEQQKILEEQQEEERKRAEEAQKALEKQKIEEEKQEIEEKPVEKVEKKSENFKKSVSPAKIIEASRARFAKRDEDQEDENNSAVKSGHGKHFSRHSHDDYDDDGEATVSRSSARRIPAAKKDIKELRGRYSTPSGRISIYNALDEDEEDRGRSLTSIRRARQRNKAPKKNPEEVKVIVKEVIIPETISVQELANRMAIRVGEVIKTLMKLGVMATANQVIDADTAELIVMEFGHNVKRVSESDVEIGLKQEDSAENLKPRPPVITIMGHVDHGKTSLLDALRKTDIALKEAGGITQAIGAYQVTLHDGRKITFIDTPGHAAFTEMRSRGANVTDIVVLVVAADDSVKDQTIEAINHAKAAGVPIIVAINKIDKHGANPDRVRKDLLNYEIVVESYGGDVMEVEISAKTGLNLNKLEDAILLQAEILELKANPDRTADGVIIESRVEKGYGPVATVLINKGTLHVGDIFVSGTVYGRVRAIKNDRQENLTELSPGTPGEIIGFGGTTLPGDDFIVVADEAKAREIAAYRDRKKREQEWVISSKTNIAQMFTQQAADEKQKILSVIVKADVQGSTEAICSSLQKLSNEEVGVKILHSGIGEVTENDVVLARASNAMIIAFNVRANMQARDQIARDKIDVRYFSIIYDIIDGIKALLSGMLTPDIKENSLGTAEVRQTFDISKVGRIAGCMVTEGLVRRGSKARLVRDGVVIYTGTIKSVRKHKDDVKEVKSGFECGISLENYNDIHLGDVIESFELEEVARQL